MKQNYTVYVVKLKNGKKVKLWFLGEQLKEILDSYNIEYEIKGDELL